MATTKYIRPAIVEFIPREPRRLRKPALRRVINHQALWDQSLTHSRLNERELSVTREVVSAFYQLLGDR